MILKQFRSISVALSVVLFATAAPALASTDEALLAAFDAYRAGDAIKLAKLAKKLEGHVLEPWIDSWRLGLTLEDASANDVRAFFAKNGNTYPGELLRADWLKVLGGRGDWKECDRVAGGYPTDDLELRCYIWLSHVARGDESALAEASPVWLEPRELPGGCTRLVDTMWERGRISITD